ncbi:MFS general substrate transporter [Coprinopsis marcescibilis]|uniref:MFS general substrate transporter n=1 Tax=Coprinopsis marcescibilis TaxID=230819 RepID=A0A5C3L1I9_COPMA|nr:MFS general substrate transporter [Coprinopsis marcescibilis]
MPPTSSASSLAPPVSVNPECRVDVEKAAAAQSDVRCEAERTYLGSGTADDPYVVDWDLNDPEDPYNWPSTFKWIITAQLALCTFTVSFGSSAYAGGIFYTIRDFGISDSVATLGISLYVLGFALGPLVWAAMGEMYGRRPVFLVTSFLYAAFQLQGALSRNIATLLSCRLLTGIFGASPLTNSGGTIGDIFNFRERGLASAIYATVPFLGPVIGPIVGGFVAENPRLGWHFNFWLMFIFSTVSLFAGYFITPETYAPVLLRKRAGRLYRESNKTVHFVSLHDQKKEAKTLAGLMRKNLSRPFVFIATEPIVLLVAIYSSIMYGTLYALFSAFPIVFQLHRGFTPGQGGLAFVGVGLGIFMGTASQTLQNKIYWRIMDNSETGRAPPEARLHMAIVGAVLSPIGLWWFAWTSQPSIHWAAPIVAGIPFGTGISQILQSLTTYLMDTYTIYFASAISATVVLRSICGAVFPLFSPALFKSLGDQWAMSVFAALLTVCMPIPILFWKYGPRIRSKSRHAFFEDDLSAARGDTTFVSSQTGHTMCERGAVGVGIVNSDSNHSTQVATPTPPKKRPMPWPKTFIVPA